MRKKVLILVTKSALGGSQRYVYDLARNLDPKAYEVVIGAGGHGPLFDQLHEANIRTIRLPHLDRDIALFNEIKAFFSLLSMLKRERPDIIHLNSPKMGGIGGVAGRIVGVPNIIYTNHGWTFHEDRPAWQKILIKIFSWIIILLSTKTIVLSEKEKKDVRDWPFAKNKISVIPLGIEPPHFLEREEARTRLFELAGIPDRGHELILSIGELTRNKGYKYALEALKKYEKPCVYMIAGTGELEENLRDSEAHLLGFVPNASQYLKGADVFLLPSIKEGLPYVILEAGFAGVPIIATNVGGISEILPNAIPPKNDYAIHYALTHAKAEIISDNTVSRYTLPSMVKATEDLYN